jgi:uncharacterized protein (UPF0261 family)
VSKTIVILATLDTKADEVEYLKKLISLKGHNSLIVDVGSGGAPKIQADITSVDIAIAGGADIEDIRRSKDRRWITNVMIKGAINKLKDVFASGKAHGIISVGGMSSTLLASSIMAELPINIPKFIISSGASMPGAHKYFGPTGITLMHSMFDSGGLNILLKEQLAQAARAICGMVEDEITNEQFTQKKPMVAMTNYGYTEDCARYISEALKDKYEIIRFHATGMPEVTMEKLIQEGFFSGVIDLVPSSVTNEVFGGSRVSWPRRLEIAAECGIPQVILPTGINTFSKIGITEDKLPPEIKSRKYYYMDAERMTVWLIDDEVKNVASVYASKLNKATGPTKFLFPMRGWHPIEKEGTQYYNPQTYRIFIDEIKKLLKPEIEIREIDAAISDPHFAQKVFEAFEEVMNEATRNK